MKEVFVLVFPGMMVTWVYFIAQVLIVDIFVEQEQKTLTRLMAAPINVNQILVSKILRCVILCFCVEFILIVISRLWVGMTWGNPLLLIFILILINFTMTGVLALIYSISKTKTQGDAIAVIIILGSAFLSGGMAPFRELPPFLQAVGSWTPNRFGILALENLVKEEPITDLLIPVTLLFLFAFIVTGLGGILLKRRLVTGVS